jgi:tRNA(fMet)-specific endonuclease VapC
VILDTNALSAFADGDKGLLRVIRDEEELALPVIVLGEYLYGIHRSSRRAQYERWLADTVAGLQLRRCRGQWRCSSRRSRARSSR